MKSRGVQLGLALVLGLIVFLLPRPEGTQFKISGDHQLTLYQNINQYFRLISDGKGRPDTYFIEAIDPGSLQANTAFLRDKIAEFKLLAIRVDYVDGLSPKAKRFLSVLAVLIVLFIAEPVPLEITAIFIGVALVIMQISDVKGAWAPYMHPVVVFIMCCLIFAITLEKVNLTKRLGYFIVKKAGTNVVKFTFTISIGLGFASSFMHDAAACAIGIITIIPLMKAAGIEPYTNTAKFMTLSLPFACSCGGMGTLIGGGRCMVAATFLKEFTGIEISFLEWIQYAMPAAILTVPAAVTVVYFVFRPDTTCKLPEFDEALGPWTALEKKTVAIIGLTFLLWLTKGLHGIDYSVTGMLGVIQLFLFRVLRWEDINNNLEWGTALFIFGGGISLGLAMGYSGAADYIANIFFPLMKGKGWFWLFVGVGVLSALITNVMANVAAAALILPIVLPMAQLEGVNPTVLALCLGMATSFAMLLIIGCPPNAIAFSYRYFKSSDLMKAGFVATPILLIILVLVASFWWKILGLV